MSPERTFQVLLACGFISGAWLYGSYQHKTANAGGHREVSPELREQNAQLTSELDELRDEVAHLRSLLKSGPFPIPQDLVLFVEKDNGLVFPEAPRARLASPAELRDAAERNLAYVYGIDGLEKEEVVWETIGLLPPGQKLRSQWITIETIDTKGLLDLTSGDILLAEKFDPISIAHSGALVHLLTRQLLIQNFPPPVFDDSEQWRTWQAIHRGAAAAVEQRYLRRRAAGEELKWGNEGEEREALLNSLSPAIQGLANFPFMEGHDYAKLAYLRSREAYRNIFKNLPSSTKALLYPGSSMPSPPDSASRTKGRIGALGLRLLLDPYLGIEESTKLTQRFASDFYSNEGGALNWTITMESPSAASELRDAFAKLVEGKHNTSLNEAELILTFTP